jgi:RNA polymerase sigma factor (sigma-70 family)
MANADAVKKTGDFSTTHWSVVLEAGRTDVARATVALERLCHKYWHPVYVFVRRRGSNHHEAEDLTQSFFAYLIEKGALKAVERRKGKFRSFLLASLTNFLLNEWDRRQTLKRGGQREIISLDEMAAEKLYSQEPVEHFSPEKLFERRWAITIIEHVSERLKNEYAAAGNAELFIKLEAGLTGEVTPGLYASWAAALNMNEGAVKVALHRLRRRFGELLRSEVAYTVADPTEVAEEIRHLLAAIST